MNGCVNKQNIEMIDGVPVDWSKFKSNAKGGFYEKSKRSYVNLIELINKNNHKLLSEYIDAKTKVLIDFNCGHEPHSIRPNDYKRGYSCPKCSGLRHKRVKGDFLAMLKNNGHTLLSEYIDAKTKVLIDFNCWHKPHWMLPNNYKNGQRCPKCSGSSKEEAKDGLIKLINKNEHKLLSEYINNCTKVLVNFNCGHESHWIRPDNYKDGQGCPLCKNKGESALYKLLLDMGYEVERQKKYPDLKDKYLLPYDFYLPKYNLLIELDGDHHREQVMYSKKSMTQREKDMEELDALIRFEDRKRKDRLKDDYAEKNHIPLLRIQYIKAKKELNKWRELILDKIKEIKIERELMSL